MIFFKFHGQIKALSNNHNLIPTSKVNSWSNLDNLGNVGFPS